MTLRPTTDVMPERGWDRTVRVTLSAFTVTVPLVAWALELGVALTPSHIVGLLVVALAAAVWVRFRRPVSVDLATFAVGCFVAVASVTVVRVLLAPDVVIVGESYHRKAVKQLVGLGFAVALFVALRYLVEIYRLAPLLIRVHFCTTAVVAVLTILQFGAALWNIDSALANFPVHNSTLGETRRLGTGVLLYGFPRVSLTCVEPSRLGIYLLTGWAFWLYARRRGADELPSGNWVTPAGILVGAALLMTGSRSAHVVFIIIAIGAVLLRPQRLYRASLVMASIVCAATLTGTGNAAAVAVTLLRTDAAILKVPRTAVPMTSHRAHGRLDRIEDALINAGARSGVSARHRIGSLFVALSVIRDYPLLGVGYGTSEFAMATRYPEDKMGQIVAQGAFRPTMLGVHAVVLTETGLLGALCVAAVIVAVCLHLRRTIRHGDPQFRALGWGMTAGLGGYAIAMTGQPFEVYQFLLLWLLLSIALSLDAAPSRKNSPST